MAKLRANEKALESVKPNPAIEARFRKRLLALIADMNRSVLYWVAAQYKKTPPVMANDDASSADALQRSIKELRKRWNERFDEGAKEWAEFYAGSIQSRSDARMKAILRKAGISVKFQMTKAQRDILDATVHENVSLITSIPEKFMNDVEGAVMRSVQTGRDLGQLSTDLQKINGVTKRRAAIISRDQNSKATSAFNRARQQELGITEAIWVHSSAGEVPRPTHLKAGRDKTRYKVDEGWLDPAVGERIWPGQLINCRCSSRPIIKGFI